MSASVSVKGEASRKVEADRIKIMIRVQLKADTFDKTASLYNSMMDSIKSITDGLQNTEVCINSLSTLDNNIAKGIFQITDKDKHVYTYGNVDIDTAWDSKVYGEIVKAVMTKKAEINNKNLLERINESKQQVKISIQSGAYISKTRVNTIKKELIAEAQKDAASKVYEVAKSLKETSFEGVKFRNDIAGIELKSIGIETSAPIIIDNRSINQMESSGVKFMRASKMMDTDGIKSFDNSEEPRIDLGNPKKYEISATVNAIYTID